MRRTSILIAATLLLVSCTANSPLTEQYRAEKMFFSANKLYQKVMINPRIASTADYGSAISAYTDILNQFDHNTPNPSVQSVIKQSYLTAAELWILQGEFDKAALLYDSFIRSFPDDKKFGLLVHFANARSNERIFNFNKTVSEYETIIQKFGLIQDPLQPNVNVLNLPLVLARLNASQETAPAKKLGQYKRAENFYLASIREHPKSATALYSAIFLASLYADQQRWYNVIDLFENLIRDYPTREEIPNIKLSLGNVYLDGLNRPPKALEIFEDLLSEDAIAPFAHLAKARAFVKQARYEQARTLLKWIMETYPTNKTLCASSQLTLASTYEMEGKWDRAVVEYRWVKEKYPITPQGLFIPMYIADYYRRRGETNLVNDALNEAIEHYRNLVKKYPKTVLAGISQEYIISCLSAQNKWENAAEAAASLKRIYPGSRSEMSSYLFLGQIYEKMKQFKQATVVYERFLKQFPDHPLAAQVKERLRIMKQG